MAAAIHGKQIVILLLCTFSAAFADSCMRGKYNLTVLQSFSPWYTISDSTNATFHINLCDKLAQNSIPGAPNCPNNTSVCLVYPNGTSISYGNYTSDPQIHDTGSSGDLLFGLKGQDCPAVAGELYSTFFNFKCGKTLGHPYYLGDLQCSVRIEWESYIFCKKLPVPEREVPCTVIKDGHLIDLSPLTKLSGGYLVDEDTQNDKKIFINVCRDITPGIDGTQNCSLGSGSCKVIGNTAVEFGKPIKGVEVTTSGVRLVYTSAEKPVGCLDFPSTTINFMCPKRGGSKEPLLLSNFLVSCSIEIEWVTEFACPVDYISSSTCQLNMEQHNINIDLSPLKRTPFDPYIVNVTDDKDHYQYLINVCDILGASCGGSKTGSSVCQTKTEDESFFRSVGDNGHMTLRYSDDKLTMTLKNGDACSSNYRRDTMIEFFCNTTAVNDGTGYPEFIEHNNCSYFFKWGTKYVCPNHLIDDTCRVTVDGKKFDLSPLVREQGLNWNVITGENEDDDQTYFLNVCHDILNTGEASLCPHGSAVCRKGSNGAFSLGSYTQPLQYDKASKSLRLEYTDGDDTKKTKDGCKAHTTINFFCVTGKLDTAPILVKKSQDDCYHEIEWHTSVACVLSHKTGDGCKVVDDDAGYVFDLSPLTLSNGSYTASGDGYNYLINVCASVKDPNYCVSSPHDNAAICQVKIMSPSDQKKVAEPTSKLEYYNGVLNLTYTNGEPYNNPAHTPRAAEISFMCDMSAGKGRPEYLEEKNLTYAFLWRSSYACSTPPMECVVTDEASHTQYDLSSLSRYSQNWQVEDLQDPAHKKRFYINVCQPLRPIPGVSCSVFASVCSTSIDNGKETPLVRNLGRPEMAPVVEKSINGMKLVYSNGDTCQHPDGTVGNFRTTIHLSCVRGIVAGPNAPMLVSPCEYSILWETAAACPVKSVDTTGAMCHVTDPNSNFTFNFMPLYKAEGYDVITQDSRTFKVSICGALQDSICGKFDNKYPTTVCDLGLNNSNSLPMAALLDIDLKYSTQGEMTLIYPGHINHNNGGAKNEIVLNFFCDRTAQSPVITFDGQVFLSTTFKVKTALACAPQPLSCQAQDSMGRQFDLTALARTTDNWIVIDTRPNHGDLIYHINVCRPVNPTPQVTCPGGAVGGCQTGSSGNFSLGYVQSEPVVSSTDGVVTILYKGGDKCHAGKDNESYRSTLIIFFCDNVEHGPVFEAESSSCEYTFHWKTPSACPQQVITGSNCKVTDPLYNYEFDLSTLRRSSNNYNVSGKGYQFLLNVCGPLVNAPGQCGSGGVSACQTGPSLPQPVHIGVFNDKPIYNSGQISLIYSEGKDSCHNTFTRSTVINFICDHSQTGNTLPQYVDEKSDCTYVFEWRTSVVCPPHQIADCTFKHGDDVFDLSRLTQVDRNYERVNNDSHKAYIINVCRSLVHTKGQTCPFNAAACMIDLSQTDIKKRFHNIGEVTSLSMSYIHETILLKYDNGEVCDSDPSKRMSTVIVFTCNPNSDALGTPSSHFTRDGCIEHFIWTSSAACPLKKVEDETTGFGTCKVTNPNTGYEFDLSSLKRGNGYKTYDREGHEFTLNVCGWLNSSSTCKNGTGSCQVNQSGDKTGKTAGEANAHLLYRNGVLMLQYSDGEKCDTGSALRSTYINFVCVPGAGNGVPVYIDKSEDCLYYFDWQTQLACETELTCAVTTNAGNTLDLSPLVKKSGKYKVLLNYGNQPQGMIYINLCRPLNPIFGILCPAGSGACLVRDGQKPLSLGRIDAEPVLDDSSKHVKLTYTNGDPCPANPEVNMTSVILFKCGTQEQLEPQLESVTSNCQYIFMWETALACAEKKPQQLTSNCTFYDYVARMNYDLSSLYDQADVKSSHGGTFSIKVCGHFDEKGDKGNSSCSKSSICLSEGGNTRDGSYGSSSQGIFQKDTEFVRLTFSEGRSCHSGSAKAVSSIYFMCDRTAGKGSPEIIDEESECEVTFRWRTSLVCPADKMECLTTTKRAMYDFTALSLDTSSWNVTDADKNIYWLNLCQNLHGPAISAGCPGNAAVCRKTSDGKVHMLGQLDSQTISINDGPTPSITIKYTDGDAEVCSLGRRRRSGLTPTVIFNLTCGDTIGYPVFQKHSLQNASNCVFEFTWSTEVACDVDFKSGSVTENNGLIIDARTKLTISLRPLISLNTIELVEAGKKYILNLGGPVQLDHSVTGWTHCEGAAICELSLDSKSYRNLGNYSSKTYYMKDDHLKVVFTSNEKCPGSQAHQNVTTTITFTCSPNEDVTNPDFLYQTLDCDYIFNWDTNLVCLELLRNRDETHNAVHPAGGDSSSGGGTGTKTIIGLSVFLALVIACVLALILYKPERRALIGAKLKSFILWRRREDSPIIYSRLSQADHEDSIIDSFHDPFNPFNEPDEEAEINSSQLPVRPPTYHDDSDEDMLL